MKKFTKEHEWVDLEGNVATVGITDHAQGELGDIVFVELPEEGDSLEQGEGVAVIESVKAVANVYCPAGGKVVEVNSALEDEPQLLNSEADTAWIARLEIDDPTQLGDLMDEAAYAAFVEGQG